MSGRWTIVAALALLGATTAGCVSKGDFDKAVAAARRANEELLKCQAALQDVRNENQTLRDQVGTGDQALLTRDELIKKLSKGNAEMDAAFKDLLKKYNDLVAAGDVPIMDPLKVVLPKEVDAALRGLVRDNPDLMDYLPGYGMVKLKSDLTFDPGSAVVKPAADDALKKLAAIVSTDQAKKFNIYAAGHTDDIPLGKKATIEKHGSNWGLSLHRAGAVVKVLAMAGVAQRRLGAMGFSKYHPVAPNKAGNKGNPVNRRVEIWIVPPERLLTTQTGGAAQK